MLTEDLERVAIDDVIVSAVGAVTARERGVDDYLVTDVETGDPFPDRIHHPGAVGARGVGQMLGGG